MTLLACPSRSPAHRARLSSGEGGSPIEPGQVRVAAGRASVDSSTGSTQRKVAQTKSAIGHLVRAANKEVRRPDAHRDMMLDFAPDPHRAQLDERRSSYLRTHAGECDHTGRMDHTLANHRDEIAHLGALLLNDVVVRDGTGPRRPSHSSGIVPRRSRTTPTRRGGSATSGTMCETAFLRSSVRGG